MQRIGIIGAGLSGRLVALNLLRNATSKASVDILMIDRGDTSYMGPAYSGESDDLLLNVPAGIMGAFSEDPEHFLKWCRGKGSRASRWDFLPRASYRDYILSLMHDFVRTRAEGTRFEHARGEVTDIDTDHGRMVLHVADKGSVIVDKAVLALGNFPPRHPQITNRSAFNRDCYVRNPWDAGVLDALNPGATVFLIGTGQTMVDLVVTLRRRAHQGRIVSLSRHGLLPMAHSVFDTYPSFYKELKGSKNVLEILRTVRRHLERAESMGIDRRAVIDSLRPNTQTIWLNLSDEEKRRFLRHLFRYWEIIRSRIPPDSEATIDAMRATGQLKILAGKIRYLVETDAGLAVHYTLRGDSSKNIVKAGLVVNCIGPESDYRRIDEPLVKNLMAKGLIRPGPAWLGIDARPDGTIIGRSGADSKVMYTLGSTMKGVLWEVLAAPDIRVQAEKLAQRLIGDK
jgi:uncharacterized NAD(P)/FAD-binding protein YdhS